MVMDAWRLTLSLADLTASLLPNLVTCSFDHMMFLWLRAIIHHPPSTILHSINPYCIRDQGLLDLDRSLYEFCATLPTQFSTS
jgi:hypothetical protein